jgi:hypothetical protein
VPSACPCCGGGILRKIGEDVIETLELRAHGMTPQERVRVRNERRWLWLWRPPRSARPMSRFRLQRSRRFRAIRECAPCVVRKSG